MIFTTFTFSEEEYSKLAKEVRGDIIKQYGEVQGDIDNEIAAKAIRSWSEGIRHKSINKNLTPKGWGFKILAYVCNKWKKYIKK